MSTSGLEDISKVRDTKTQHEKEDTNSVVSINSGAEKCPIVKNHIENHDEMAQKCPCDGYGWMSENLKEYLSHCIKHRQHVTSTQECNDIIMAKTVVDLSDTTEAATCPTCGRNDVDASHVINHDRMIYKCPEESCDWKYENFDSY